ncbi:MAG: zf-TFIIB domain-containing protein [Spirulinaceae cyanobacterium RM2_2_10]|nr:zf-TFIIB domain-containing protein [Spirulinaceae cyanobacterium SM2_1_0]NJO20435.1 zf-TFIIB domain-containing protein [Spirulinaceae cyanobacterium RM2_2_10]
MNALRCPHCDHSLASVVFEEIEVNRCEACGGLWFDASEAEQLKAIEGSEVLDRGGRDPAAAAVAASPAGDRHCPRCYLKMTHILDLDEHSLWYEQCPRCGGLWLDAGEFRQFKENFRDRSFLGRARQRLGFKS